MVYTLDTHSYEILIHKYHHPLVIQTYDHTLLNYAHTSITPYPTYAMVYNMYHKYIELWIESHRLVLFTPDYV